MRLFLKLANSVLEQHVFIADPNPDPAISTNADPDRQNVL
jgi:hypothetical protein